MSTVNLVSASIQSIEIPEQRAEKILNKALSCKAIRELYERVKSTLSCGKAGAVKVKFVNPNAPFPAISDFTSRKINIRSSCTDDEALSCLVFELINFASYPRFQKIYEDAQANKIGREEYAKKLEEIEFEGAQLHDNLIKDEIQKMGWRSNFPRFSITAKNFEDFWKEQKSSQHTAYFRLQWAINRAYGDEMEALQKKDEAQAIENQIAKVTDDRGLLKLAKFLLQKKSNDLRNKAELMLKCVEVTNEKANASWCDVQSASKKEEAHTIKIQIAQIPGDHALEIEIVKKLLKEAEELSKLAQVYWEKAQAIFEQGVFLYAQYFPGE